MEGRGSGSDEPALVSPSNKVKFMCSHGGRILPRPSDGHLKYVGGETRVVAVAGDIKFGGGGVCLVKSFPRRHFAEENLELMQKITNLFDGDFVLKYQIIHEDLDALVSVRNDEDLHHMISEYNLHGCSGSPKLRTFLFPFKPVLIESQSGYATPHALHQHYVDAINGIVHLSGSKCSSINTNRPMFSISACSSPKSLSPNSPTTTEPNFSGRHRGNQTSIHKVWSSPTLFNLGGNQPMPGSTIHHAPSHPHQSQCYYQNQYSQQCNCHVHQRPPEPYRSGERFVPWQPDMERHHHMRHGLGPYRPPQRRHHWGGSGMSGYVHPNESNNLNYSRGDSLPPNSPRRE